MVRIGLILICLFASGCSVMQSRPEYASVVPQTHTQQVASNPGASARIEVSESPSIARRIGETAKATGEGLLTFSYLCMAGIFNFPLM